MRWLGTMTGASGGNTNVGSGMSGMLNVFTIPKNVKELFLSPSASGLFIEIGSTGLATDPTRGAPLGGPGVLGPYRTPGVDGGTVVAMYSTQGVVSMKIFGSGGAK